MSKGDMRRHEAKVMEVLTSRGPSTKSRPQPVTPPFHTPRRPSSLGKCQDKTCSRARRSGNNKRDSETLLKRKRPLRELLALPTLSESCASRAQPSSRLQKKGNRAREGFALSLLVLFICSARTRARWHLRTRCPCAGPSSLELSYTWLVPCTCMWSYVVLYVSVFNNELPHGSHVCVGGPRPSIRSNEARQSVTQPDQSYQSPLPAFETPEASLEESRRGSFAECSAHERHVT